MYDFLVLGHEFGEDEVEEILKRAISIDRQADDHDALTRAAAELGVSTASLEAAKEQWLREKAERELLKEFLGERVGAFRIHMWVYAIVNGFFLLLNLVTNISERHVDIWFVYPMLAWGIGLAIHAVVTYSRGAQFEDEFRKWSFKRRKRNCPTDPE